MIDTGRNYYFRLTVLFILIAGTVNPAQAQERPDPFTAPLSAAPLWEESLGRTVSGTPHLQASSVVLAYDSGNLGSFFMSGTDLWRFEAQERATPHISRSYEGATYMCNTAGVFMAVNRVGRQLWQLNLGTPITFPPVVGWDGRVFIPVEAMMTCRTASGRALWTLDLGSPMAVAPVLDKTGSAVTVLRNMDFVKITQFSNTERIRLDRLPSHIVPLLEGNQSSYALLYPNGDVEKIVFNAGAAAGSKLSRSRLRALPAVPVAAAGRDDQAAVILRDGRIVLLDASGGIIWTRNSHETTEERGSGNITSAQASVMFDERGIYSISTRGMSGFTVEGRRRFVLRLNIESSGIPSFSDEGLLYACGRDNVLRVYKTDAKPRTVPRNRYYGPEPEGNYGMGNPPPSPWAGDRGRYTDESQGGMYDILERDIRSGELGEREPIYVAYMMEMIGFFLNDPHYSPVRPAVRPPERIRLIGLLGQIGSRETVPFLWNIFDKDPEPSIKRACADAIGTIGVDPTGRSFEAYDYLLGANNPNYDQQLLLSAANSIAKLCRFAGPPIAARGIRVLRHFTNLPTVPNPIRVHIQNEINALRIEGLDTVLE
ncbi:MAG: PQQ-like beta-propeller repeat protein [Treponema sp.]|nr:PQQ-like beta-propeller repeat protein [Treponema sp.]